MFTAGRQRAQRAGVELEWIAADAEDLRFEDERFTKMLDGFGVVAIGVQRRSKMEAGVGGIRFETKRLPIGGDGV